MAAIDYEPDDINEEFPPVSTELLEVLQKRFPDKLPTDNLTISDRALWVSVGEARVVKFLKDMSQRRPI